MVNRFLSLILLTLQPLLRLHNCKRVIMSNKRVYDLPTRVFHSLFALLFITAFSIGNTVDDDSSLFSYHMIAGLTLCFLVVFRIFWGLLGSKYARFSHFSLHPKNLFEYFRGILSGDSRKWVGHNPASSWAAIVMMLFSLGLGISGYLMSNGPVGEDLEEIHELLGNGFLVIVLLHIAGIALHSLRHKDRIWKSMISGKKSGIPEETSQVPAHSAVGILLLVVTIGFAGYLTQNFDRKTRNVTILGAKFHLGEADDDEHEYRKERSHHSSKRKHHDHDDDD